MIFMWPSSVAFLRAVKGVVWCKSMTSTFVSFVVKSVNVRTGKAWSALHKLDTFWKSELLVV